MPLQCSIIVADTDEEPEVLPEYYTELEELYGRCKMYFCYGTEEDKKNPDTWEESDWFTIGPISQISYKKTIVKEELVDDELVETEEEITCYNNVRITETNIKDSGKIEYVVRSKDLNWDYASFALENLYIPGIPSRYTIDIALDPSTTNDEIKEPDYPIMEKDDVGRDKAIIDTDIIEGKHLIIDERIKSITFDPNNGVDQPVTIEIELKNEFVMIENEYEHPDGKVFKCWAQDRDGNENPIEPNTSKKYTNPYPLTYYAVWN